MRTADPVTHGQGLGLVVRDVDGGDAEAALERRNLGAGLDAELRSRFDSGSSIRKHLGLTNNCTAHRDAADAGHRKVPSACARGTPQGQESLRPPGRAR